MLLESSLPPEQRQSPRLVALVPGELTLGGRCLPCTLEDISAGGARVQCEAVVGLEQGAMLRVMLPGPGLVAAPARLVYRFGEVGGTGSVYGLAFATPVDLAPRPAAALRSAAGAAAGYVLVVHPSVAVGRQLAAALTSLGRRSVGVTSLAEAARWLDRAADEFAAAMVDGSLAQSDGGALLGRLAQQHAGLRRITLVDPLYMPLAPGGARLPPARALPLPWDAAAVGRALDLP